MKHTIISEVNDSDRNIVMFVEDGTLVGINYWYGIGDLAETDYLKTDVLLFNQVKKYYNNAEHDVEFFFPSPCFDEQVKRLDKIMSLLNEVYFIEKEINDLQQNIKNLIDNL